MTSQAPPPSETKAQSLPADELKGPNVLTAEDLRVDVAGVPSCDGLTLRVTGERVLVLGAPRALFLAAAALLPVERGALTLRGQAPRRAITSRVAAAAPATMKAPPRWTVREYIEWSARLAGVPSSEVKSAAEAAIARLALGAMEKTAIGQLVPHARRALIVAATLATYAEVILLDDPLGGLPDDVAATYANILKGALDGHPWIAFAPRISMTSPLTAVADEAIVATSTEVLAQGSPAAVASAARTYVARLSLPGRDHDLVLGAIATEVASRGGRVEARGARTLFDLGPSMSTHELFQICASSRVGVLELHPVASALT